jgi:hypothetical protein
LRVLYENVSTGSRVTYIVTVKMRSVDISENSWKGGYVILNNGKRVTYFWLQQ